MTVTGNKSTESDNYQEGKSREISQCGLFFDQTRCDGCYACAVACKDWHDIAPGPANWIRISTIEKGKYPNPFLAFNPEVCHHCLNAPCVEACPSQAICKRGEDGIVVVDREKCVGKEECGHPCSHECPAGNDVVGFIEAIREGKYAQAWRLIVENNPFPGVCGRVCYHPCESACVRSQVDEGVGIHSLERFAAQYMPTIPPFTVDRKKQRVAIVGSGPAGMSCAYYLARQGYRITVFEALPVAGGMLRVGIPEYRLPKAVVEREIAFIENLGVEIKTNMRLGKNLSLEELDEFDAVFLAVGAHKEKTLDIDGIDLKKVVPGVDFLRGANLGGNLNIGRNVVVLGGGNVAVDCARTASRLGATETHLVFPEREDDITADISEQRQSEEEGLVFHASSLPCKIHDENGQITGVECMRLRSMEFDDKGQLQFEVIEDSEFVLPADMVILAIGQEADLSFLPKDIKVERNMISIDENGSTSRPKYFAGGDAAISERRVAWAIGSGRKAAEAIDRYIKGLPKETSAQERAGIQIKLSDTDFIEKKKKVVAPPLPIEDRLGNFSEIESGLSVVQARLEADRCLTCRGMCFIACPYDAPQFGPEENPKMQKCDFCLEEWENGKKPICVRSCTMRALDAGILDDLRLKYGDIRKAEGASYYEKTEPAIVYKPKNYTG